MILLQLLLSTATLFPDKLICEIVSEIRESFSDCAITLSIGEKSKESYLAYFNAGANRYLLRHETADEEHYINHAQNPFAEFNNGSLELTLRLIAVLRLIFPYALKWVT